MTAKIDGKEKQPICSTCADELRAGGFKVTFGKDAWLHMDKCSVCGRRLPVHDGTISGRGRRRRKNKV